MSRRSIGINLLWLVPDDVGGSEESTVASLRALAERGDPDLDVRLFALPSFVATHRDLGDAWPVDVCPLSGKGRASRIVGESTWLAARTRGLDLVHHAGGTAPPIHPTPFVLTIHDVQPLERSASHTAVKRAYLRLAIPRSVAAARSVIVPSEFVRRTVLTHTGADPSKVIVVPHGVGARPRVTPESDLRTTYELPGPVVLYPAITYPHKNHKVLVNAFASVLRTHPAAVLVLTGRADAAEADLQSEIAFLGLDDHVRRLGRVSSADVAGLYDLADVVAVPSRYEGFGLPAVEAMNHGTPVVAATGTALDEVVAGAGVLVDPDDVAGWGQALNDLLGDPVRRTELADAGRARAGAFTWSANAAGIAAVYRSALRRAPRGR